MQNKNIEGFGENKGKDEELVQGDGEEVNPSVFNREAWYESDELAFEKESSGEGKAIFEILNETIARGLEGIGGKPFQRGRRGIILGPTSFWGTKVELLPNGLVSLVDKESYNNNPYYTMSGARPWSIKQALAIGENGFEREKAVKEWTGYLIQYLKEVTENSELYNWPTSEGELVKEIKGLECTSGEGEEKE